MERQSRSAASAGFCRKASEDRGALGDAVPDRSQAAAVRNSGPAFRNPGIRIRTGTVRLLKPECAKENCGAGGERPGLRSCRRKQKPWLLSRAHSWGGLRMEELQIRCTNWWTRSEGEQSALFSAGPEFVSGENFEGPGDTWQEAPQNCATNAGKFLIHCQNGERFVQAPRWFHQGRNFHGIHLFGLKRQPTEPVRRRKGGRAGHENFSTCAIWNDWLKGKTCFCYQISRKISAFRTFSRGKTPIPFQSAHVGTFYE